MNFPKCGITERQWWAMTAALLARARVRGQYKAHAALLESCVEELWLTGAYL